MHENDITGITIGCAIEVHKQLGPGLLESTYREALLYELRRKDVQVEKEVKVPLKYKSINLDTAYRLDLIINNKIIVELKSVESLNDLHFAQLLTYLKLTNCKLGLLINFNVAFLKTGIRRVVNGL